MITLQNIKNIVPSRRFFLAIIGILVAAVGVLVLVRIIEDSHQESEISSEEELVLNSQIADRIEDISVQDSDADGLMDWEESLWGTDPSLSDTDGNGLSDKIEIENRRQQLENDPSALSDEEEPLTTTDILARDLYTTVSVLGQQGTLDSNRESILSSIATSLNNIELYQPINVSDLNIVSTNYDTILTYVGSVWQIMTAHPLVPEEFENLMKEAATGPTDTMLILQEKYINFVTQLEGLEVPVEAQDEHVFLVNSIRYMNGVIYAIIHTLEDPALGMAGVRNFIPMMDGIGAAYDGWYRGVVEDVFYRYTNQSGIAV